MKQCIGNVGVLDLLNATEESVKRVESIENVGMVLYRKQTAPFISSLNIGNIGKSVEVPVGYSFINGILNVDLAYLQSITTPVHAVVNGAVIIARDVLAEQLDNAPLKLIINGNVYCPPHLSGTASSLFSVGGAKIDVYEITPPRFENGVLNLTNSFLAALDEPQYLVVNGVLNISHDVDMEKFKEKINKLQVNGVATIFQDQETEFYKKVETLTSCKLVIIPTGFEVLKKSLRLNSRSIRRFQQKKIYTRKPIIIEADVTREMLANAFTNIYSTSIIICHETTEDLLYELSSVMETEILSYENSFVWIEENEVWSNDQLLALEQPVNFIVNGQLSLDKDVQEAVIQEKISTLDILGEVMVSEQKLKGTLQNLIRVNTGRVKETDALTENTDLHNVGVLSL
ncbi:hypothetical protein [Sutcliffiella halmapala]|uniref:hypothetical protein n=1 Tax=Sutcliffiella halmapala TaxID=79882 RepID=UPI00099502CE|nr:hypothetical protein [Sutcliffiella halmapala]